MELNLTELEQRFCEEYLIDLNGTRAYQRAFNNDNLGSCAAQASTLLRKLNVRTYIRELMDERSKDTLIDAKYVVDGLTEMIDRCKQAVPVMEWDYEAKEMKPTGEWKFDSIGANKAYELLGKHVGMFNDKLKIDMDITREVIIEGKKFADKTDEDESTTG